MTTQLNLLQRDWVEESKPAVLAFAATRETFCSDDLHPLLPAPEQPKWFGILLASLKREGRIERVGYAPSSRPERNGGIVARWRVKHA